MKTLALMSDMSFLIWSYHSEIVFKDGCQELTKQGKVQRTISVQGQRGPKRGFPTLRCDAPGGGWRCDAATLRRSGGRVALRRCDAATLPLGQ